MSKCLASCQPNQNCLQYILRPCSHCKASGWLYPSFWCQRSVLLQVHSFPSPAVKNNKCHPSPTARSVAPFLTASSDWKSGLPLGWVWEAESQGCWFPKWRGTMTSCWIENLRRWQPLTSTYPRSNDCCLIGCPSNRTSQNTPLHFMHSCGCWELRVGLGRLISDCFAT